LDPEANRWQIREWHADPKRRPACTVSQNFD